MPVRKKYISVFTSLMIMVIISCNNNKPDSSSEGSAKEETTNPAPGKWRDTKDTSHTIILTETQWLDYYNGEQVSANKIVYETKNYTGHNGRNMGQRKFIRLEESEGNFYNYQIVECDSFRLHLLHLEPGREMFFLKEGK